jgi:hypothetical protein
MVWMREKRRVAGLFPCQESGVSSMGRPGFWITGSRIRAPGRITERHRQEDEFFGAGWETLVDDRPWFEPEILSFHGSRVPTNGRGINDDANQR